MLKVEFESKRVKTYQKTVRIKGPILKDLERAAQEAGISVPAAINQILETWAKGREGSNKKTRNKKPV